MGSEYDVNGAVSGVERDSAEFSTAFTAETFETFAEKPSRANSKLQQDGPQADFGQLISDHQGSRRGRT